MQIPRKLTVANFGEQVKGWTYEKFMETFTLVFPSSNLEEVAAEMGLKKAEKPKKIVQSDQESK